MHRLVVAILSGGILGAGHAVPAAANDSSAELGTGGIQLVPNWDIVIDREDLYVSPDLIGVRYVFRNTTNEPVSSTHPQSPRDRT